MDKKAPQTQTKPKFSHLKALVYSSAGIGLISMVALMHQSHPKFPHALGE